MKSQTVDLSGYQALILMVHNSDGTVTVGCCGMPDELLRLVCAAVDVVIKDENGPYFDGKNFPLILLAGLELWCLNHAVTLEELINDMRGRISLSIPNNNKL